VNFDFSDEQKLLQQTVRDYLDEHAPLSVCRRVLESGEPYAPELWKGAAEMGWLGAAIPESYGGAGFGRLELVLIAEELGRALAPIPFGPAIALFGDAVLRLGSESQKQKYLPALARGEVIGTFALAERAGRPDAAGLATRFENGHLSGTKIAVADGSAAHAAIVVARERNDVSLVLVDLSAQGVQRKPAASIDPSRPLATLELSNAAGERLGEPCRDLAGALDLLRRGAVVASFEQIGGAARALEITREFALGRYAFGRPIASFQALKHRMADVFVAIELARSNAYYAAWALDEDAPELAEAAATARVSAIQAYELAATEMIQMHGGVGFTWEYDCHLFYRRAKSLAAALGGLSDWREYLMRELEKGVAA
jgi:alkylation response protein AidB-like acyl-CoA dehydrogenase